MLLRVIQLAVKLDHALGQQEEAAIVTKSVTRMETVALT